MFKHFWFIVGFILIVGTGMAACTAIARAFGGRNPVHQGMDWVNNGKARQAEHDGTVANWIDRHGGNSGATRPTPMPKPLSPQRKPSTQKGTPIKTKKK